MAKPQKKSSKPTASYVIKDEKEKGKVIVAGRTLKQGTVIFTEEPILSTSKVTEEDILEQYNKLKANEKEKILSLVTKDEDAEDKVKVMSLFKQSSINNTQSTAGQALYFILSRVKHSCGPNIVLIPQPDKAFGRIEVRASRTIKKGEELRADYLPGIYLFEPKDIRCKTVFGQKFECDCKVCKLEGPEAAENEDIRKNIKERYRNTTIYVTLADFPQAYDHCKAMLGFMETLENEIFPKRVSVTLECWQLAVLAKLQRPDIQDDAQKYKEKSKTLCTTLGPLELEKWKKTEKNIEANNFSEFDTVKLRASGPWTVETIKKLSEESKIVKEEEAVKDPVKEPAAQKPTVEVA